MFFYTLEVFHDMIPQFVESIPTEGISKFTLVSADYDFDIEVQGYVEEILSNLLTDSQLEQVQANYNPSFFPESVVASQFTEEEHELLSFSDEELEEHLALLNEEIDINEISLDGLPKEDDLEFSDLTQVSYSYIDPDMDSLKLNVSIMIDIEHYQFINFDTNITVH